MAWPKGKPMPMEARAKRSVIMTGRPVSAEARAKIRAGLLARAEANGMIVWEDDRLARLKEMRAQGLAASKIAKTLGVSLSQVKARVRNDNIPLGKPASPWTDEMDGKLRALWEAGKATALIGEAVDMSKSAVIGRARRLGLSAHKSRKSGGGVSKVTAQKPRSVKTAIADAKPIPPAKPVARAEPIVLTGPVRLSRETCSWAEGERRAITYCDHRAIFGKRWCPTHWAAEQTRLTKSLRAA